MSNVITTINNTIKEIQELSGLRQTDINEYFEVVKDLGFASLDVAQLIATLEIELGIDPFANGVPISEVKTVGELYHAYENELRK